MSRERWCRHYLSNSLEVLVYLHICCGVCSVSQASGGGNSLLQQGPLQRPQGGLRLQRLERLLPLLLHWLWCLRGGFSLSQPLLSSRFLLVSLFVCFRGCALTEAWTVLLWLASGQQWALLGPDEIVPYLPRGGFCFCFVLFFHGGCHCSFPPHRTLPSNPIHWDS